jgi:hypothetical protein
LIDVGVAFLVVSLVIAFTVPAFRLQRDTSLYAAGMPKLYSVVENELAGFTQDEDQSVPETTPHIGGKTDAGEEIQVISATSYDAELGLRSLSVSALVPGTQRFAMEGAARLESINLPQWVPDESGLSTGDSSQLLSLTTATPTWGRITGGGLYRYGSVAHIVALPSDGKHFLRWDGAARISDRNSPTTTVTIDEDRQITAVFAP